MSNNREFSQLASYVEVKEGNNSIGIATGGTQTVGIATTSITFEGSTGYINAKGFYKNGVEVIGGGGSGSGGSGAITLRNETTVVGTAGSITELRLYGDISAVAAENQGIGTITVDINYVPNAGIATFATKAGIATNVLGGIGTLTALNVSGVITSQNLTVTGVSTFKEDVNLFDAATLFLGDDADLLFQHNGVAAHLTNTTGQFNLESVSNLLNIRGEPVRFSHGSYRKLETTGVGVTVFGSVNIGAGLSIATSENTTDGRTFVSLTTLSQPQGKVSLGFNTTTNYTQAGASKLAELQFDPEETFLGVIQNPNIGIIDPFDTDNYFYEFQSRVGAGETINRYVRNQVTKGSYVVVLDDDYEFVVSGTGSVDDTVSGTNDYAFKVVSDAQTELYHNQNKKLETTGYGVTITGGLSVSGVSTFYDNVEIHTDKYIQHIAGDNTTSVPHRVIRDYGGTGNFYREYAYSNVGSGTSAYYEKVEDGINYEIAVGDDSNFTIGKNSSRPISGSNKSFEVDLDGATTLYYNHSKKLETIGVGVSIIGAGNTATISGPSDLIIDPSPTGVGETSGNVYIKGDLYVQGTQFQVDSTTINLADKVIGIATTCSNATLLNGAGIGIGSDNIQKTIKYNQTASSLKSNENFDLDSGKVYKINGTDVLSSSQVLGKSLDSSNTNNAIVIRNASGGFSAGVITATQFSGPLSLTNLNVSGVATFAGDTGNALSDYGTPAIHITSATNDGLDFGYNSGDTSHSWLNTDGSQYYSMDNDSDTFLILRDAPGGYPGTINNKIFEAGKSLGVRLYYNGSLKVYTTNTGASVTWNLLPGSDATYDLGSSSNRWNNIYTTDLNLSNEGNQNEIDGTWGKWTIQEGEEDLFLINRRTGKKYKFLLDEV